MIFVTLANAIYLIFSSLLSFINIPLFPVEFTTNFDNFVNLFIENGMALLTFLLPVTLIRIGIPLVIVLIFAEQLYAFAMWVIRKIPLAGMS